MRRKKNAEIVAETQAEVSRVLHSALQAGDYDLEAVESSVRAAMLEGGKGLLGQFMTQAGAASSEQAVTCPQCRLPMKGTGRRDKQVLTILGHLTYTRSRYQCPKCRRVRFPGDEALDLAATSRSPGVRRQIARLGAKEPFHEVATDMRELAGLAVSRKDAERIAEGIGQDIETKDRRQRMRIRHQPLPLVDTPKTIDTLYIEIDGTGVPMVEGELQGRKGKQSDGSAKTREVKLGCVFTQSAIHDKGRSIRDPNSTTFTGGIENAEAFGQRIYAEAVRQGLFHAKRVVVLSDTAEWIRTIVAMYFPMALHIIDFYHAKQHINTLCKELFVHPNDALHNRRLWWDCLAQGNIETIIEQASACLPNFPGACKTAQREIQYLRKNAHLMRYATFKNKGLFIGSGVIEAACKTIVAQRLKQSAMKWTVQGANAIIALRCNILSGLFTDYWDQRAA